MTGGEPTARGRRVVITGIGATVPAGIGTAAMWEMLTAGRTATRTITLFDASGFRSRVAHHIDFPDYADGDLLAIGEKMLGSLNYGLSECARAALAEYIPLRRAQPLFANARSVRNALDRMRLRQANRLVAAGELVGKDDLVRLEPDDIRVSRVFAAGRDTMVRSAH